MKKEFINKPMEINVNHINNVVKIDGITLGFLDRVLLLILFWKQPLFILRGKIKENTIIKSFQNKANEK